jgi:hypothetical protein
VCANAVAESSVRYLPAGQAVQVLANVAPVTALYFPAPQIKQSARLSWLAAAVAAFVRYVPLGHETHVLDAIAAVAVLYFPARQIKQAVGRGETHRPSAESKTYPAGIAIAQTSGVPVGFMAAHQPPTQM